MDRYKAGKAVDDAYFLGVVYVQVNAGAQTLAVSIQDELNPSKSQFCLTFLKNQ